jgi:hypothetical protein
MDGDQYEYSANGKLKKVTRDGVVILEITYDYAGNKVKEVEDGVTTYFVGKDYTYTPGKGAKS